MRWFRSNGGGVAWLAIFALACQFVLTFGHIHSGRVGAISAALAISGGSAGAPPSPAQKVPTGLAQDFCAVCNNIGLANALVLPVSPATVPPISLIRGQWPLAAISSPHVTIFISTPASPPTPDPRPERLHRRFHRLNAPLRSSARHGAGARRRLRHRLRAGETDHCDDAVGPIPILGFPMRALILFVAGLAMVFLASAVQTFGTNWLGQDCPYPGPCFRLEWLALGIVLSTAAYIAWKLRRGRRQGRR
jgi:hypothetical protein